MIAAHRPRQLGGQLAQPRQAHCGPLPSGGPADVAGHHPTLIATITRSRVRLKISTDFSPGRYALAWQSWFSSRIVMMIIHAKASRLGKFVCAAARKQLPILEKDLSTAARAAPLTHERVAVGKPPVVAHDRLSLMRNLRSREQVTGVAW